MKKNSRWAKKIPAGLKRIPAGRKRFPLGEKRKGKDVFSENCDFGARSRRRPGKGKFGMAAAAEQQLLGSPSFDEVLFGAAHELAPVHTQQRSVETYVANFSASVEQVSR